MRFDDLFDDLADAAAAESARQLWDEAQELARAEACERALADRVEAGSALRVWLRGGHVLTGTQTRRGEGWWALRDGADTHLVRVGSVLRVRLGAVEAPAAPAGRGSEDEPDPTGAERIATRSAPSLRRVLLVLARDRAAVQLSCEDGAVLTGRLLGVGADHVSVAGDGTTLVALTSVAALRV